MKTYNWKIGAWKAVKTVGSGALMFAVFSGVADVNVWTLVEQYAKPILSAVTVGGLITLVVNYAKIKLS